MRKGILFLALFAFIACSNSSSEVIDEKEQLKPEQPVDGTLTADGNSAKTYDLIKRSGYNHEAPDSSREHKTEHFQHIQQVHDNQLNKYVFAFFIHAEIDDDRGLTNITDRQRNEIKTDNKSPNRSHRKALSDKRERLWCFAGNSVCRQDSRRQPNSPISTS